MDQQQHFYLLEYFKTIVQQVRDEVKKLFFQQEELNRRDILTIKNNTTQILKLFQGKQGQSIIERKFQPLHKIMEIKHNAGVFSILELSDLKIATGWRL